MHFIMSCHQSGAVLIVSLSAVSRPPEHTQSTCSVFTKIQAHMHTHIYRHTHTPTHTHPQTHTNTHTQTTHTHTHTLTVSRKKSHIDSVREQNETEGAKCQHGHLN